MSNDLERPAYYAILPAEIRYSPNITSNAKLLYAEITALSNKTGTCWASNKYLSELYGVNVTTISEWVKQLINAGFITSEINKEAGNKRYLRISSVDPIRKKPNSYSEKAEDINNKTNKVSKDTYVELKKQLLLLVNKHTGRAFRTLPETGVKKTLDTFSLVEINSALSALAADAWHQPKLKELSIAYFVRSTTIDRFLGSSPKNDEDTNYFEGEKVTIDNQDEMVRRRMGA